ncbi:hypothetical protein GCM10020219_035090 [Nonomuraea dietziae]
MFVARQRGLAHPVLDVRLFRSPAFTASLLISTLIMVAMSGSYLFVTGFLQMVEGLSPARGRPVDGAVGDRLHRLGAAGATLARRFSMGTVIGAGLAVAAAGYVVIAFAGPVGGLPLLVTGFVVSFFGTGPIGALGTHLVVSSAPPEQGGSAASLQETSGHLGVAAGIAALGSLGAAVYREKVVIPPEPPSTPPATTSRARWRWRGCFPRRSWPPPGPPTPAG